MAGTIHNPASIVPSILIRGTAFRLSIFFRVTYSLSISLYVLFASTERMFRFAGKSSAGAADSIPTRNRYTISWKPALRKLKNSFFSRGNVPEAVQHNNHGASGEPSITALFDKNSYQPLNNQRATLRTRTPSQNQNGDVTRRLSSYMPKQSNVDQQPGVVDGIELVQRPSAITTKDNIHRRTTVHRSSTPPPPNRNPSRVSSRGPADKNIQARPSSHATSSADTDEFSMALRNKLRRASMAQGEELAVPKPVAYIPTHAASDFLKNGSPSQRRRSSVRQKKEEPHISAVDENSEDFQNFVKNCHLQHLVKKQDWHQTRMSLPVVVKAPKPEATTTTTTYDTKGVQDFQKFLRNSHIHYLAEEDCGWRQSIAIAELNEETDDATGAPPSCFATPRERGLSMIQRRRTMKDAARPGSMAARPVSMAGSILGKVGEYIKPAMPVNAQRDSMMLSKNGDTASIDSEIPAGKLKRWSMAAAVY